MKKKYYCESLYKRSYGKISDKVKIILASGSPRRKEILGLAGFDFSVVIPKVSERVPAGAKPSTVVKMLALKKAKYVYEKITAGGLPPKNEVVVGSDTIVVLRGKIIGKPREAAHAVKILRELSGSSHYVYTGVAVIGALGKKIVVDYEKTEVIFKKLSDDDIEKVRHAHLDKAGAYSIQEENDCFVKKINGDYLNVVGFPLKKFKKMLLRMKI